jgi:hypothetical protein
MPILDAKGAQVREVGDEGGNVDARGLNARAEEQGAELVSQRAEQRKGRFEIGDGLERQASGGH